MIIGFQKVPEGKVVKNRVHLDFWAADEEAAAREVEAMGATRLWVSEDPRKFDRRPRRPRGQRVLSDPRRLRRLLRRHHETRPHQLVRLGISRLLDPIVGDPPP